MTVHVFSYSKRARPFRICWTKISLLSWECDAWWETCIYEIMTTICKDLVQQILEGKNQQLPPNLTTESKMIRGLFEFNMTGVRNCGIPKHFCTLDTSSFEGCDSDLFGVFKLKLIVQIDFFKHILSFKFVQCFTNQPFVPADCDARIEAGKYRQKEAAERHG